VSDGAFVEAGGAEAGWVEAGGLFEGGGVVDPVVWATAVAAKANANAPNHSLCEPFDAFFIAAPPPVTVATIIPQSYDH
jgi:hypothetical protein